MRSHLSRRLGGAFATAALGLAITSTPADAAKTLVAKYGVPGNVAAGQGWLALTREQIGNSPIVVGRIGGEPPTTAKTGGRVPDWAMPHIGTDAKGRAVMVYPTCLGGTCDLHAYDLEAGTDTKVPGASDPNVNEREGDMDRGALAFVTRAQGKFRLRYRPKSGAAKTINAVGGTYVDLESGRILTVRELGEDAGGGSCGATAIEVTTLAGQRTVVSQQACAEDFQQIKGAAFIGKNRVGWGVAALSGSTIAQRDLGPGAKTVRARSVREFVSYAPVSRRDALILEGSIESDEGFDEPGVDPDFPLWLVTGSNIGAKKSTGQSS